MGRALIIIRTDFDRARITAWAAKAPEGTRVEFKAAKRTLDQNARMWAMITEVARQKKHNGRRYTTEQWKVLFLHACGREVQFMPSLDNTTFIPWGWSSSDLSVVEMSELIDFIDGWGAQNGVVFNDPVESAAI